MSKIVVDPGWVPPPGTYRADVRELVQVLQQLELEYDVELAVPEPPSWAVGSDSTEYSVAWWEFINISVPWDSIAGAVAGAAVTKIVDAAVEWARHGRSEGNDTRDRPGTCIKIYGPNGEMLKSLVVATSHGEPEDRTAMDQKEARRIADVRQQIVDEFEVRSGMGSSGAMVWIRMRLLLLLRWVRKGFWVL